MMPDSSDQSDLSEQIKELEAILRDIEGAENPDFETIADIQAQIDELKAEAGGTSSEGGGGGPVELDTFDNWASEASGRYADPDAYGDGQSFNAAETEPAPEAAAAEAAPGLETTPVQSAPEGDEGLSEDMQKVMMFLVENVVVKAYNSVTFKGKKKLPAIVNAAQKSGGPSPLGKLSFNIKRGLEQAFGKINYSDQERHAIIFHLVLGLDENIYAIEHQDAGAARILKSIIAQNHLPSKLYKKLDAKGAFNK